MSFFVAVVFVLANGTPYMMMSERFYPSEQHCVWALRMAGEQVAKIPGVQVAHGKCFPFNATSV